MKDIKILLVEDDNNLREIFELRLIAEGYQTVTAGNGEEALVVAMKEKPDLIIADVMMPKLSGFEMLETLRAAPEMADTKCIMMTALGQAEDRARGERLGVIKYLVKSQVTLEDFVRVVREVVPPDGSSGAPQGPAPASNSQPQTNVESEQSMQPDNQTPAPADQGATPSPNPINDSGAAAVTPDQPTAAQEQSQVQDQINNFVSSAPAGDAATPADAAAPSTDPATPAAGSDAATPDEPAADVNAGPAIPVTTAPPPAPETSTETTPPPAGNTL